MRQDPRQARSTTNALDEVQSKTWGGSLGFSGQVGTDGQLDGTFAANRRMVQSGYYKSLIFSDATLDTWTCDPRYTLNADLAGHRNKLLLGVDFGVNTETLQSYTDPNHTNQNTQAALKRGNAGAYVQDEFWMTDKLALTLGARGELYRYTDATTDFSSGAPAYSDNQRIYRQSALDAELLYRPTEQLRLFTRVSTLYRDPFVDELTSTYGGPWGTPGMNLGLKPEIGRQYEIGSSVTIDKAWSAAFSLYRLDMQDEIAYGLIDPSTYTYGQCNLNTTRRYGADASLTWQQKDVGLVSLAYDYVDAFYAAGPDDHKELPLVPAHVVTAHGELDLPLDLAALATVRAVSAQYLGNDDSHDAPRLPTYATLDVGLRYRPHHLAGFELFAGIDNVLDSIYANSGGYYYDASTYANRASYYPAAGRTWKVTASYRF